MEQVKSWVLSKCKDAPRPPLDQGTRTQIHRVVVTPKNIPAFTIPRSSVTVTPEGRTPSPDGADLEVASQSSGGSLPCSLPTSNHSSPRHSPTNKPSTSLFLQPPGRTVRSKSAPVSPSCLEGGEFDPHSSVRSCNFLDVLYDDTNADPMSLAAMSLPHFKVKTAFGFDTLTQNPHTRRRESLFHSVGNVENSPPPCRTPSLRRPNKERNGAVSPKSAPFISIDTESSCDSMSRKASCRRRNVPSLITPLGVASTQQCNAGDESPDTSPRNQSPSTSPQGTPVQHRKSEAPSGGQGRRRSSRRQKVYFRRRSSLTGLLQYSDSPNNACPFCQQPCPDPGDPDEGGAQRDRRRSSDNIGELLTTTLDGRQDKLHRARSMRGPDKEPGVPRSTSMYYSTFTSTSTSNSNSSTVRGCTCNNTRDKLEASVLAELGEAKVSLHYYPQENLLKVLVVRAENLGGRDRSEHSVNPCVKLCLMPGRRKKQTSGTVKHTRNPVFNQEFFFSSVSLDDLKSTSVKLRFVHKPNNLRRGEFLGEAYVPLNDLSSGYETRLWRNLQQEVVSEELGCMQVKACFEPSIEKLCVTVLEASDLPKHPLTGAPDPYVKVELVQPGRGSTKRQTKTKKKAINPKFEESFVFDISPKIGDLNYTGLTLTVYDHERIRSDEVVGQVRLGYGATENSEFQHWNQVLQHPGQEFVHWHTLMQDD